MKSVIRHRLRSRAALPDFFGASVRGPNHKKSGRPCEDAWLGRRFTSTVAVSISDGLGSKRSAAHGALSACASAMEAARLWDSASSVPAEWVCRWLEAQWRFAIAPEKPQDCAATCHLLAAHEEAGLIYAGIGDGMALLQIGNQPVRSLSARSPEDFINETISLGVNHRMSDWIQTQIPAPDPPWIAVLVTDGIAGDLRTDKLGEFTKWLREEIVRKPRGRRVSTLRRALLEWPTPGHLDDKTVAVLLNH